MRRWAQTLRQWWAGRARDLGDFQARLLLTIFYFTVVLPFGLLARLAMDPLRVRKPPRSSVWTPWPRANDTMTQARRQF